MRTRNKVLLSWASALLCGSVLAWILLSQRHTGSFLPPHRDSEAATTRGENKLEVRPRIAELPLSSMTGAQNDTRANAAPPFDEVSLKSDPEKKRLAPTISQPNRGKPEPLDPVARAALAFVGTDPAAEAYWYLAINDPALPPVERQDLIEDLNEDGLSDPKHPTVDDLPVIVARLAMIEGIASDAMDDVNAEAFAEAYKDLVNLAAVALADANR